MCIPVAAGNAPDPGFENAVPAPASAVVPSSQPAQRSGALGYLGLGLQAAGAFTGAFGAYTQSKDNQQALNEQARIVDFQAKDAERRGALTLNKHRLNVAQIKGTQRAALAARGLALDEGSALNILQDTDYLSEVDASTIQDNTAREAWALRTNASQLRSRAAQERPGLAAATSLLSGATGVAKSWYALRNTREVT